MAEQGSMTGREAILHVKEYFGVPSMYAMAKALSGEGLNVQTGQISNYLNGTRMSKKVAQRFYDVYGVVVSDAYEPAPSWQQLRSEDNG